MQQGRIQERDETYNGNIHHTTTAESNTLVMSLECRHEGGIIDDGDEEKKEDVHPPPCTFTKLNIMGTTPPQKTTPKELTDNGIGANVAEHGNIFPINDNDDNDVVVGVGVGMDDRERGSIDHHETKDSQGRQEDDNPPPVHHQEPQQHREEKLEQQNQQKHHQDPQQQQCCWRWRKWYRAYLRNLLEVDTTQAPLVPPIRTAIILMVEWIIFGIANNHSTAFQLGALYVGFTDPNVSLGQRLRYMGLTEIAVVIMGAVIPSLVWDIPWLDFLVGIPVSYLTGLAPILNSDPLSQAMKLGTALYAINGAVNRESNGYGGFGVSILWTFFGATTSLVAALIPELIGNREAARTDLYKVWHGLGRNLQRWGSKWITRQQFEEAPTPTVTMTIARTQNTIANDSTEDYEAKKWMLSIVKSADNLRTLTFCLSNGYSHRRKIGRTIDSDQKIDDLLKAVGKLCNRISYRLQFPWSCRYIPTVENRLRKAHNDVRMYALDMKKDHETAADGSKWLPSLMDLLLQESESAVDIVTNVSSWPPYSSISSIPERILSAFPTKIKLSKKEERVVVHSYAIRFAFAFSLASIPELLLRGTSAHWFPMTVALIMGQAESATLPKVGHRMFGTLIGIGLGALISPLFRYPYVLILLMGLNTYAACVYFKANYSIFTIFITSWVFTTTVGAGADLGITILYRCCWTFSAGLLVLLVTYTFPQETPVCLTTQLIDLCRALKVYAECVLIEHNAEKDQIHGRDNQIIADIADLSDLTKKAREGVIRARVSVMTSIHDRVVLTPKTEQNIDPHTFAPAIASDLVDAVVVPQFVSLAHDDSVDDLLVDFDQRTFAEIDRLMHRLEFLSLSRSKAKAAQLPRRASAAILSSASASTSPQRHAYSNRGPFSNAIAAAHRRLDELDVPSDAIIEEEEGV